MKKFILLTILVMMTSVCQSKQSNPATEKDFEEDLKNRKILLSKNAKEGKTIRLKFYRESNVKDLALKNICKGYKIKSMVFESENFNENFFNDMRSCDFSVLESLVIYGDSVNVNKACSLFMQSQSTEKVLSLTDVSIPSSIKDCFLPQGMITGFALYRPKEFTGENFCDLVPHIKKITFLRGFEIPFGKKHLQCILDLPHLNYLTLQRWKGANTKDFHELVEKYEEKYKRKLQADVDDPRGYEFDSKTR